MTVRMNKQMTAKKEMTMDAIILSQKLSTRSQIDIHPISLCPYRPTNPIAMAAEHPDSSTPKLTCTKLIRSNSEREREIITNMLIDYQIMEEEIEVILGV